MDFFENQDIARRKTAVLIGYYLFAVALIVISVYLASVLILTYETVPSLQFTAGRRLWQPTVFVWTTGITLVLILGGSLYKIKSLAGGGRVVAEGLGGSLLNMNTRDPEERKLLNVVEEMAIASGTPMPPVYLLREEGGINALVAGYTPSDAVMAVTRGCIETLSREELQGVVAHEFSHILNGDMRLNIRMIGILHGILLIGLVGRGLLRSSRYSRHSSHAGSSSGSARGKTGGVVLFALALTVIGYIGVFFASLIKAAISRQREFLADASAVQFTRQPAGIAGALKKIGGYASGSELFAPQVEQASHMFFANGLTNPIIGLLATHPPLEVRVKRIEPSFRGRFPKIKPGPTYDSSQAATTNFAGERSADPLIAHPRENEVSTPSAAAVSTIKPDQIVAQAGAPTPEHLAYAAELIARLPNEVVSAAHEPFGARALVYGLLLKKQGEIRQRQLQRLREHADELVFKEMLKLLPALASLPRQAYVPLMDMALPALRGLSDRQYRAFRENLNHIKNADGRVSLFEFVLQHLVIRHLDPAFTPAKPHVVHYYALKRLGYECTILLSALAYAGHTVPEQTSAAFNAGIGHLDLTESPGLMARKTITLNALNDALDKLSLASPKLRKRILAACVVCTTADGQIKFNELELLRTVADALDIPLPPFMITGNTITNRAGNSEQENTSQEPKDRVMMGEEPFAGKPTRKVG